MEAYQIAFWLVTAIFGIVVTAFFSMWNRTASRIDKNFDILFDKIEDLAKQKDLDKLKDRVNDHHDRLLKIEQKIINCKTCTPNGKDY